MPLINWSNLYSVNIVEIDNQHQKLINIINQLFDAMKEGKANDVVKKIVNELVAYTNYHFTYEENLLAKNSYPELEQHKLQHKSFVQKIEDYKQKVNAGSLVVSIDMLNFLKDWLLNHIGKTDKNYSAFLNSKGVR